ncbi:MAG: uridine kinase [Bacteroidales bacterium]|nr:uridine kinase [Bacteroidales bacterium]
MLIVGIAGGSGSGKTTVVKKIIENLPQNTVTVIPQDSYYKDNSHIPLEERRKINFDHPNSIEWELLVQHIKALKNNQAIEQPTYSYLTCTRNAQTVHIEPSNVILIEGIMVLGQPELRDVIDLKVFVDADPDDRLSRIIERDIVERGRDVQTVLTRYDATVKPSHLLFIEPTKRYADIIVPQGGHNSVAINLLTNFIKQHLK